MEIKQDISYGVLPFTKERGEWKVFLIYQYGSAGDVFWTFPKGHPEAGESPEESAKRELFEETGLTAEIQSDVLFNQSYSFRYKEMMIDKIVTYYLGIVSDTHFSLQEAEVKEAGWFSIADAKLQLTHDSAKQMFAQVLEKLPN